MYRGMYVKKRRPKPVAPISIDDEPRGIFAPGSFPLDEPPPVSLQAQRRRAVRQSQKVRRGGEGELKKPAVVCFEVRAGPAVESCEISSS